MCKPDAMLTPEAGVVGHEMFPNISLKHWDYPEHKKSMWKQPFIHGWMTFWGHKAEPCSHQISLAGPLWGHTHTPSVELIGPEGAIWTPWDFTVLDVVMRTTAIPLWRGNLERSKFTPRPRAPNGLALKRPWGEFIWRGNVSLQADANQPTFV